MSRSLLSLACHVYGVAAIAYLACLVRQRPVLVLAGRLAVGAGLLAHVSSVVLTLSAQGWAPRGLSQGFSLVALLLFGIFLGVELLYRVPVMGSFIAPAALTAMVFALLLEDGGPLSPSVRLPLLPLHISVALLGIAAFGVAAGVAVMYLLLERQVKGKKFGVWFTRLPSLQFLDELNRRLVVGGFIALSVTLVTGAFFVSGGGGFFWAWQPKEVATLVAWLVFGALLNARLFAGWQGRRVALLTVAGFCILLVSFFSSFGPFDAGVTR